ncbi:MAG: nucleoside triphosphate pyrophosphatase [Ilumatobacteraceae bacterium]
MRRLVLASGSPRRRELLGQLGLAFDVVPADIDETPRPGERARDLVRRLAEGKARAVDGDPVLAADTVVEVDGEVFGKPVDADDARRMLGRLSARSHHVHTGVAVRSGDRLEVAVETTTVVFTPLAPGAIDWYLGTGEPFDKAGAYAIQGAGGIFVEAIRGSVSNVVGLPLTVAVRLLEQVAGWPIGRLDRPDA